MNKAVSNKGRKFIGQPNPLEVLKDIGDSTVKQMKSEVGKLPTDFMDQLFGIRPTNYSGEIAPGEALEISEVFTGRHQEIKKAREQIAFERRLLQEERTQVEKKTNELKMELTAIKQEILVLVENTQELAQETEIAAMQSFVEPGIYHVIFFEKLLEFIKSFRKKIEDAAVWLSSLNRRAGKKNVWGSHYKSYGAKYLLSGEHYLQRSAG